MFDKDNKPIGFRISEVSRLFKNKVRELTLQNGVSTTVFSIIGVLKCNDGKKVTQKDICKSVKMKAPTISLTLQDMENDGLITRTKDDEDSRKTYVILTSKGLALAESVHGYFVSVDKQMESALSKEELEKFYEYLDRITQTLERNK